MNVYSIEKLNANNYFNWASDIKYLLIEKGVWDIVNETLVETKDAVNFKSQSNLALSLIYLNIDPEYRKLIEDCDNPVVAWKKIKVNFCPDSRSHHMKLFTDLMECKINVGESVSLYSARLFRIANQLKSINTGFDMIYASFQLLRYLPVQFDSIVQNILRWDESKFKYNEITTELVAEETRLNLRKLDLNNININNTSAKTWFKRNRKVRCFKCNKLGHVRNNCFSRSQCNFPGDQSKSIDSETRQVPKFHRDKSGSGQPRSKDGISNSNRTYISKSVKSKSSSTFLITQANVSETGEKDEWIFDSGASHHFCNNKLLFKNFSPLRNKNLAVAVKGVTFPIEGKGSVQLRFGERDILFNDVMYSSKLRRNLISGPKLDQKGAVFYGGGGEVNVYHNDEFIFKASLKNGIYYLNPEIPSLKDKRVSFETLTINKDDDLSIWHRRAGHISPSILVHTARQNCVKGLPDLRDADFHCEPCKINKFRKKSFRSNNFRRAKNPLELLYADVWGPSKVPGRKGERYFLSIIDDYSRKVSLYPIMYKDDVFEIVKQHINRAENFLDRRVKFFRSDNGGEFDNRRFQDFFAEKGIKHELTNTYTPQQNGVVERYNQTVADGARTILSESNLDDCFWPEAMLYFVYTWNRMCSKTLTKTPFELYGGTKPSVRHLKPFGTVAYAGVPSQKRSKLDAKARRGILVGYAFRTKGYRIWFPDSDKIEETINVSFNELIPNNIKHSGAVLGPQRNYIIFPEGESSGNISLKDKLEAGPSRTPTDFSDNSESEGENLDDSLSPTIPVLKDVNWVRRPCPRTMSSRIDVYYYEENKRERLRSLDDVKRYCNKNNILFKPELFNFSGTDDYSGVVTDGADRVDSNVAYPQA